MGSEMCIRDSIGFIAKRSFEQKTDDIRTNSASGLNEAEISILKSVIRDEVTQAAQTAMQASTDGTEKFFTAKTETLEEQTKSLLSPTEKALKDLEQRVEKLTTSYDTHQGKVSRLTEEMLGMNTAANKMVQAMHLSLIHI